MRRFLARVLTSPYDARMFVQTYYPHLDENGYQSDRSPLRMALAEGMDAVYSMLLMATSSVEKRQMLMKLLERMFPARVETYLYLSQQ